MTEKYPFILDDTNLGFNSIPKICDTFSPTLRAGRYGLKVVFKGGTN